MGKYKLVEVRLDKKEWDKRNVIFFNNDGSVVAVSNEKEQLNDDYIVTGNTTYFPQWREIQQPTWKPFPNNESMGHLKDCWFRFKDNTRQFRTEKYDPDHYNVFYILGKWWSKEDLFEKAEVLTNGQWQPVGLEV